MQLRKEDKIYFLLLVILSIIFLLFYSANTSPIFQDFHGWDSAFFGLVGNMINSGKLPYVDIVDQKGPIIYYLYALGLKLYDGREGMFIIQSFFFVITNLFVFKTILLFIKINKKALFLQIICMLFFAVTFENGGLTEELTLPFIVSSNFYMLRYLMNDKVEHNPVYTIWYGISFAWILCIRITNAAMMCGFIFCICIYLLHQKKIICLFKNALAFCIGVSVIIVPISIYLISKNAFDDMLFNMFVLGGNYAGNGFFVGLFAKLSKIAIPFMIVFFSCLASIAYCRKGNSKVGQSAVFAILVQATVLILGNGYMHYYTLLIPGFVIGIGMFSHLMDGVKIKSLFREKDKIMQLTFICLCMSFLYYGGNFVVISGANFLKVATRYYMEDYNAIKKQTDIIPVEERDSVLAYNIRARWYIIGDLQPCYRLACFQENYVRMIPELNEELVLQLENDPPLWVAVELDRLDCPTLEKMLQIDYKLMSEEVGVSLYRRNI